MSTVQEVFERNRAIFRPVPDYSICDVCTVCRGPVAGYLRCYGCKVLTEAAGFQLEGMVAPMTIAPNPGPWYSRLAKYKTFHQEHATILAALTYLFLVMHMWRVEELLGGEVDHLAFVPSTRRGGSETQPLRRVLSLVAPLEERAATLLRHASGQVVPRQTIVPDAFICDPEVRGRRIVLLDDTWVTGAKAVSAARALYDGGADRVLIMPIARMVQPGSGYYPQDHPYFSWIETEYDLSRWPL